ncbi:HAD hydrolase family protein [Photobacterium damselae subsp. damselae]|uniref:3-deoxy-D-manno-octulosonate 8-phosphate phosphatase KdsC n=1 Tax=Photobacterium damselae subsp. damselae TaxID=85581 RepID=A0A850QXM3_PHODD|nr:HAD hydrolase family protein [Photobacterium damselae subsp. damselae]
MVLLDVDGVMTDGTIFMSGEGEIIKAFNVKDGLAIELLRAHGFITGVISGKASPALTKRCEQLGFDIIITGCKNKLPKLIELGKLYGISSMQMAFCGDDILDIPVFQHVRLSVAPSDAHQLALDSADWVMDTKGGRGMVRDFVDLLIMNNKKLELKQVYEPLLFKIQQNEVKRIEQ